MVFSFIVLDCSTRTDRRPPSNLQFSQQKHADEWRPSDQQRWRSILMVGTHRPINTNTYGEPPWRFTREPELA